MPSASPTVTVTLSGDINLKNKLQFDRLMSRPMRNWLTNSSIIIENESKSNLEPRNYSADLYNSIKHEVDASNPPWWAAVGSNLDYAPYHELGTKPHYPNIDNITPWALDHGWDPYDLAFLISVQGTQPHPFMKPAVESSIPHLVDLVTVMAREIEQNAMRL